MTLPSLSVRVTTVLLKEVLMYALPETMFFFVLRRRERPPAGFPCAFAIESSPYRATCADYLTSHAEAHNLYLSLLLHAHRRLMTLTHPRVGLSPLTPHRHVPPVAYPTIAPNLHQALAIRLSRSTLPLFVTRIGANDQHRTLTTDHFALLTHRFYRRSYFHN